VAADAGNIRVSSERFRVDPDDYTWLHDELEDAETRNRPRTKKRPAHSDAAPGMIIGVDRGRYRVHMDENGDTGPVTATRAKELRKESLVVGDRVDVVGDVSGAEGALGRIVRIAPRKNVLRRSADDTDHVERVIVANIDQLVMVVAAANPEPRTRLIDRYIVAALDQGITPVLVVTKTDLAAPDHLLNYVAPLDIPHVALSSEDPNGGLEELTTLLQGRVSVFVGHSGVGKSTLVNRLVPEAGRAVGDVNVHTGRGRHTSSSSVALSIDGGWIIDTPGVRSFGLGHVTPESIAAGFDDLADYLRECPKACSHAADQAECGLARALASDTLDDRLRARIRSLRLLLGHREDTDSP
jgi:ribosome biogenesis GTPase / thiamine phosphate phosphatase